jgi:hypothetical protein
VNDLLPKLAEARTDFLAVIKSTILWAKPAKPAIAGRLGPNVKGAVSIADVDNASSVAIAWEWASRLPGDFVALEPAQDSGKLFQFAVRDFLERGFRLGSAIRRGNWHWKTEYGISNFDQYAHMNDIRAALEANKELRTIFSEQFLLKPDIVVYRSPIRGEDVGRQEGVPVGTLSPLLDDAQLGRGHPLLHASVSCKITMRSDRAQNTRTEALNLLRNRKGHAPAIVAVTAEPLPTRLSSLALGTGDVDFVYHAALPELREALSAVGNEDQLDMLNTIVQGRRLRDISDLVLDLLI